MKFIDNIIRKVVKEELKESLDDKMKISLMELIKNTYLLRTELYILCVEVIKDKKEQFLNSEELIDSLIERINKKQLKGGG